MPSPRGEGVVVSRSPDQPYDAAVNAAVTTLALGLAALFTVIAAVEPFLLDGRARLVLVPSTAVTALLFGAVALVKHRWRVPDHLAHPVTSAFVLVVGASAVAHMVLLDQPLLSTNLLLVVVGAGAVLLSLRWLLATLYLVWGGWAVGAVVVGPAAQWPHFVAGLVAATTMALGVNYLRRTGVRELARLRVAAEAASVRDPLTGVANRRGLAMVGGQMVETARRHGDAVHCIFVDVNGLRRVNEASGNAAGDEVLVAVAEALRTVTRATDIVARWGGDEFCVVGPGPGMPPLELERRVRDTVAMQAPVPAEPWPVGVSAGGAMLAPWDAGSLETLLAKADQEMYLRRSLRTEGAAPTRRAATAE
ncbi:MAG: diguanylate cyclase domain-containing protein [Actinomycetes bacterium]